MAIEIIGEEKRPVIICPHCKGKVIVDISPFNKNITGIAEFTCNLCRGKIYAGVLVLANATPQALFANIEKVVQAAGAKNTYRPKPADTNARKVN